MEEEEKDKLQRIGKGFDQEILKIQEDRKEEGLPKESYRKLTNQILKHLHWKEIRHDLTNFVFPNDKRGLQVMPMFLFFFAIFFIILVLGIFLLVFNQTNTQLDRDIQVGGVNLQTVNAQTFGAVNNAFVNSADFIGYILIFGLILAMFLNAYLTRNKHPQMFLIVDILLLIFAYILSVYISSTYETLINSTAYLNVYINNLPRSSTFILNLPKFVGIIGAVIMILSYAGFPKKERADIVGGF